MYLSLCQPSLDTVNAKHAFWCLSTWNKLEHFCCNLKKWTIVFQLKTFHLWAKTISKGRCNPSSPVKLKNCMSSSFSLFIKSRTLYHSHNRVNKNHLKCSPIVINIWHVARNCQIKNVVLELSCDKPSCLTPLKKLLPIWNKMVVLLCQKGSPSAADGATGPGY